jgi:tripartite-type tricarboxylate transporter receptor subunit TctC
MLRSIISTLAAACLCLTASAQTTVHAWPTQPIKLIVPFTPGTGMDTIARIVAPRLSERLGQAVIVENKAGASGNIGADSVAKSAPDGYTLMVGANTMLMAANLYKSVPFNPLTDFAPISLGAWGTLMLTTNPKTGISSVSDLIAKAKAAPGKLTYGSPGVGTPHHMAMELFKDLTGSDLLHIPYKGSSGAVVDILSGSIDLMFIPIHVAMPYVKAGKLKPLAVGSPKRHPMAPDLPTLQELGVKGAEVDMWYAFLAPKGTPSAIISRLNSELRAILAQAEVRSAFEKQGLDAASSSSTEMSALMQKDFARWAVVIKKNNISAE